MPGRATPFGLPAVVPKAQDVARLLEWHQPGLPSPPANSQARGWTVPAWPVR